ncbi:RluA family pseudouridine synthase [Halarcobacter anaerophilus]|uniref:RNA pseudouridylate synthase n=1 Tax=Halarcobacter anaerophilus TaxID=877500 RepID=A0A4Q0Y1U9_9BACT|nr:RluA family pseudouridine synthase [Halarcobacter anaerophilus]QDF27632.1 RNA pseudouridine synthase [Halarcobacter anaerophilus]RXJ63982.1 RNA pseudouridine synthase [Halarcobacter anaerophilus]
MPFVLKKFSVSKGKKIQVALMQEVPLKPREANRLLSRSRVFNIKKEPYLISEEVKDDFIYIALFEGHSRGLKPLLVFEDFAIFDKPSNLMIHPISKKTPYSLLDEIRYHFGDKANQAHRIDAETSGLVLVGFNEKVTNALATMFEKKEYKKSYLAIVEGEIKKEITINKNLKKEGKAIGVRMTTCEKEEGKESITHIKPLKYNKEKNLTLLEVVPITGRQHQIRVHLYSIGHKILGDPIYGVNDDTAEAYLDKTLLIEERIKTTGSNRLWLQANYLEFTYKKVIYKIFSKNRDIYNQFSS